jgi:hypothetical protein
MYHKQNTDAIRKLEALFVICYKPHKCLGVRILAGMSALE